VPEARAAAPNGPLLLLSPHLDDVALSCAALLERAEPLTIYDVFTQRPEPEQFTELDKRCGFEGSNEAMDARWAEENQAFDGSPHAVAAVDLLDEQYRDGPRDDRDTLRLERALDSWLAGIDGPVTVAMPVGAGAPRGVSISLATRWKARRAGTFALNNSADHFFVRDTAISHLRDADDVTFLLYEEYPYLYAMGGSRVVPMIETWVGRRAVGYELAVDPVAKARRVAAYTSQLDMLFRSHSVGALGRALPRTERYWELGPT